MKYIFWEQDNAQQMSGLPKLIVMGIKAIGLTHQAALISCNTSLVYQTLLDEGVPFMYIEESSLSNTCDIDSEDVLILPTLSPRTFVLHKFNPKVILWQIFPSVCVSSWLQHQCIKWQLKKVVAEGAYISMDRICYDTFVKEVGLSPNGIIPMPIDHSDYVFCPHDISKGVPVNVSYLGRALDWKINGLIRMLKDMGEVFEMKFLVHVFTDDKEELERLIRGCVPANVTMSIYVDYHGKRLLDEISKMDIHFAMGISTLEGAALGIPTLVAPLAYTEVPVSYTYRWLYEDVEHYAGDTLENDLKKKGWTFRQLLQQITDKQMQARISKSCYQATLPFSLSSVGKALGEVMTTLHLCDCHYRMLSYWKIKIRQKI